MTLEEAKALHRKVSGIRAVFRIGLDHLEQEKPVLAFKVLAQADSLLYDILADLSNKFPHEL